MPSSRLLGSTNVTRNGEHHRRGETLRASLITNEHTEMNANNTDLILDEVVGFLRSLNQDDRRGPANLLYNEGWLLRLVLAAAGRGIRCLPDAFEPGACWFTEARLYTPFQPRTRGDTLGESVTHADGVIGHFVIGRSSRGRFAPHGRRHAVHHHRSQDVLRFEQRYEPRTGI